MSGKETYEFGDLSIEIDKKVKESVAQFCGQEKYEFGMLSKELAKRMKSGVASYTGKSGYKFGDITKTAVKSLTGKDEYKVSFHFRCIICFQGLLFLISCLMLTAASLMQFGDVTKSVAKNLTGKDDYQVCMRCDGSSFIFPKGPFFSYMYSQRRPYSLYSVWGCYKEVLGECVQQR